jgi:hypothetical protein
VARDAIKRLDDVDASSVTLERENDGAITFEAKKGKSINLEKLHEGLKETRLSGKPPGRTGSVIHYLEITATGQVVTVGSETVLRVSGTGEPFTLGEDLNVQPKGPSKTLQELREALAKGAKVVSVTGRVQGWSGHFPKVLRFYPPEPTRDPNTPGKPVATKPPVLIVTDFQTATK